MVLVAILFFLGIYAFGCYVIYLILRKFDATVSYGETLIPVYNFYLLLKQAVSNPGIYFLIMMGLGVVGSILEKATEGSLVAGFLVILISVIDSIMMARVWGLLAEKLGKGFWLYAVLSLVPIVNLIIILILAFGDSRPVSDTGYAELSQETHSQQ